MPSKSMTPEKKPTGPDPSQGGSARFDKTKIERGLVQPLYDEAQKFSQKKQLNSEEWLWNVHGEDDDVLRAACLIEYVRETTYLREIVDRIDHLRKALGIEEVEQNGILECQPFYEHGLTFETEQWVQYSEFVSLVLKLARAIFPLPIRAVLRRGLKQPFFEKAQVIYQKIRVPTIIVGEAPKLREDVWVGSVLNHKGSIFELVDFDNPSISESLSPPKIYFSSTERDRTLEALIIERGMLGANFIPAIAYWIVGSKLHPSDSIQSKAFSLTVECSRGSPLVVITEDPDKFCEKKKAADWVFISAPNPGGMLSAVFTLIRQIEARDNPQPSSLATCNREFLLRALRAVSSLRINSRFSRSQFEDLIRIFDDADYKSVRKFIHIPTSRSATIRDDATVLYEEMMKRIFPSLTREQGEPVTGWQTKQFRI